MMDMFMDTWFCDNIENSILLKWINIFAILNSLIALPTKYRKLNVQRIKMISQYHILHRKSK